MASSGISLFNHRSSGSNLMTVRNDSSFFQGSTTLESLENVINNSSKRPFFSMLEAEETGDEDMDECIQQPEKKRRLTAEQVHFLEKSFEVDNKLEPERKTQLARDLGLQPRQVAVWFQNRRARWKTKQLEKEYDILKSSYESLRANYDNLLKEKEKLNAEVICLTDKLHAKEKGFEIQTKDADEKSEKPLLQSNSHLESIVKTEFVSEDIVPSLNPQIPCCYHKFENPLSSGSDGSAVLDEDSPHQIDSGHSSTVGYVTSTGLSSPFEADLSDLSRVEEEEEESISQKLIPPQDVHILRMDESFFPEASAAATASCTFPFCVEDQENLWWNWSYSPPC